MTRRNFFRALLAIPVIGPVIASAVAAKPEPAGLGFKYSGALMPPNPDVGSFAWYDTREDDPFLTVMGRGVLLPKDCRWYEVDGEVVQNDVLFNPRTGAKGFVASNITAFTSAPGIVRQGIPLMRCRQMGDLPILALQKGDVLVRLGNQLPYAR